MRLTSLDVSGFRNLKERSLSFSSPLTLFYGENAQGKTNVLEAIYVLATSRSFRERRSKNLIQEGQERAAVGGEVIGNKVRFTLCVELDPDGKKLLRNQSRIPVGDYVGCLPAVVLSAEDRGLVKGHQKARRDFLDAAGVLERPGFLHDWLEFRRALDQRNNLLRQGNHGRERELAAWTETFCELAEKIRKTRGDMVERVQSQLMRLSSEMETAEEITLRYVPSGGDNLPQALVQRHVEERRRGVSLVGPQRDVVHILMDGKPIKVFGSSGQVRTALWMLKLARVLMIHERESEPPLFLLDDVEAELDRRRIQELMNLTKGKAQVFMTATRKIQGPWGELEAYRIRSGEIREGGSLEVTS
ncbi:MAG: DNA replication and repair protein RecF [Acidobacteriota bacterium]